MAKQFFIYMCNTHAKYVFQKKKIKKKPKYSTLKLNLYIFKCLRENLFVFQLNVCLLGHSPQW